MIQIWLAVAVMIVGLFLLVCGLFIKPVGEIHPSVLTAFGEISTFVGAVLGIDANYKIKIHRKDEEWKTEE